MLQSTSWHYLYALVHTLSSCRLSQERITTPDHTLYTVLLSYWWVLWHDGIKRTKCTGPICGCTESGMCRICLKVSVSVLWLDLSLGLIRGLLAWDEEAGGDWQFTPEEMKEPKVPSPCWPLTLYIVTHSDLIEPANSLPCFKCCWFKMHTVVPPSDFNGRNEPDVCQNERFLSWFDRWKK